jgi:hypothetical protein
MMDCFHDMMKLLDPIASFLSLAMQARLLCHCPNAAASAFPL